MAIATRHSPLSRSLLLLGIISLAACGGGGSGSKSNNSSADASVANSIASSVGESSSSTEATGTSSSTANSASNSSSQFSSADTTPAAFSFTPTIDAALGSEITSNTTTITGIDKAVPVSITNGEYSINGGAFTSAAGTVSVLQTIAVKVMSSSINSTPVTVTLTVGSVSATYTVTTLADAIPDAFSFDDVDGAPLNSIQPSGPITVSGIEVAVAISITGGEYSIDGGAFTAAAGTVTNGQTVKVKAIAPATTETTQEVVVTIGGVSATYSITTIADTFPPVAEFKFPTPYTMSEANSVKVRGTAMDDNAITSVKVVVTNDVDAIVEEKEVTPKAEGDYSSWTVDVPLTALAENEIKVIATDDRENETQLAEANKVVIRQADVASAFPDDNNQLGSPNSDLILDNYDGRNRLLLIDSNGILAVDMITGQRTKFLDDVCGLLDVAVDPLTKHFFASCDNQTLKEFSLSDGALVNEYDLTSGFSSIRTMKIDRTNGRARLVFVDEIGKGKVGSFSLDTKLFSVVSAIDQLPEIQYIGSMVVDGDYYLIPGGRFDSDFGGRIVSVHATTGERKIISDNSIGSGDQYTGFIDNIRTAHLVAMVKDSKNNNFLAFEFWTNKIISIDATTFNRKIISDVSYKQQKDQVYEIGAYDLQIDESAGHLYLVDWNRKSAIIVDSETGEKLILSKSENNF